MRLENINPFVRRAFFRNVAPEVKMVKNVDCRLFYILEGSGKITVNGVAYEFNKGALGIWKSGSKYCWDFKKSNKCKLAIIHFDYTQNHREKTEKQMLITEPFLDEDLIFHTDSLVDSEILNEPIFLNNMHIFKPKLMNIINEYDEKRLYYGEMCSGMLKQFIIEIVRYVSANVEIQTKIEPILEYIRTHYNEDISNASLGKMANYHPHYINSLAKKYMGTTLHSYLNEIRLGEALKLIINTSESIENIAFRVGYKNPTHFCTSFKKKNGLSPAAYRKSSKII